ncbi:hypothetical protein [Streptomyces beijiangensis]|uniref:Uncharacterized protein n=1 Tax=Streptomyces beijiangensis TaxID=163361 RepID=A0A939F7X9_9ACTN|nr:hypothetical protein [Streptomyces beijiangensis]MBO0513712.1 hypothetical protein [Streptomyces beijiangensis]
MSSSPSALDPVIPRFCAQTGASLPLAWEFAWSPPPDEAVVRLTPPPDPRVLDRDTWPRRLAQDTRLSLSSGARLQHTPVPFLYEGGPVAVLFRTDPAAFVEVPGPVGDALVRGTTVAEVRRAWGRDAAAVDHKLVGMMRYGLLCCGPAPRDRRRTADAGSLVQEAWVEAVEREDGGHVLAHTATGNFLRTGEAAFRLWQWAGAGDGDGDGIDRRQLPAQLHDVAGLLLSAGMLRAVEGTSRA